MREWGLARVARKGNAKQHVVDVMDGRQHPLTLPELGSGEMPVTVSLWLVEVGAEVTEGDRVVEVVFGSAAVDLPAPVSGVLVEVFAGEDEPVSVGQVLGMIAVRE